MELDLSIELLAREKRPLIGISEQNVNLSTFDWYPKVGCEMRVSPVSPMPPMPPVVVSFIL